MTNDKVWNFQTNNIPWCTSSLTCDDMYTFNYMVLQCVPWMNYENCLHFNNLSEINYNQLHDSPYYRPLHYGNLKSKERTFYSFLPSSKIERFRPDPFCFDTLMHDPVGVSLRWRNMGKICHFLGKYCCHQFYLRDRLQKPSDPNKERSLFSRPQFSVNLWESQDKQRWQKNWESGPKFPVPTSVHGNLWRQTHNSKFVWTVLTSGSRYMYTARQKGIFYSSQSISVFASGWLSAFAHHSAVSSGVYFSFDAKNNMVPKITKGAAKNCSATLGRGAGVLRRRDSFE